MENFNTDAIVIGAGVVGLAIARALANSGKEVIILEKNSRFGEGISSRNSEVIHAGIYYPNSTLKTELCISGRKALYDYCDRNNVEAKRVGKWLVATSVTQAQKLSEIELQAEANGVELVPATKKQISENLPDTLIDYALWSPTTGIINSHNLMLSFLSEVDSAGGYIVYNTVVEKIVEEHDRRNVIASDKQDRFKLSAPIVVNSAGLGAVDIATNCESLEAGLIPTLHYAKGSYFDYSGRTPFKSLVYPTPEPGGLGIHLTLDLAGRARFGPNVEWVDKIDYCVNPNFHESFYSSIKSWWPKVDPKALQPSYAGIRPKLHDCNGSFADFKVLGPEQHGIPGMVHLFGVESPGLTSCMSIAEMVNKMIQESTV